MPIRTIHLCVRYEIGESFTGAKMIAAAFVQPGPWADSMSADVFVRACARQ